jgi:Flp pilus assembly protein TadG
MRRSVRSLFRNSNGAVAPIVALSLVGLIAAGGVAFDYARLASLDTELQDAADQAALAAATQLDGQADAAARAAAAAQGLLQNQTRFGNDSCGVTIETGVSNAACTAGGATARVRIMFFTSKSDAESDANAFAGTATNGATAKFVRVEVAERKANYALTPIVAAFSSGSLGAAATAGLGSALCKIPPLMMCNPDETSTNLNFNVANYKGKGIKLVQGGAGSSWAAGNFGYLESGTGNGASAVEYALGANTPPGNCLASDGVSTKPGQNTSVTDAINTRFDIYENGLTNSCTTGTCSPSNNVRKDVVRPVGSTNFGYKTGSDPWDQPMTPYLPASSTGSYVSSVVGAGNPSAMGMPRDKCHAVSPESCAAGRVGTGDWDRDLYFFVNHLTEEGSPSAPDGSWKTIPSLVTYALANGYTTTGLNPTIGSISRYDVYKWEIQADSLAQNFDHSVTKGSNTTNYYNYARPQSAAGLAASSNQPDRRLISMAVVNCAQQGVQGQSANVLVAKWVELFLVEPSIDRDRTVKGDVYVEVVRETNAGGSAPTNAQVVKRDVPYLVK